MRTVVSVTPLSLERDSRTFKQAASVTRLGYDSVVVERYPSHLGQGDLPFHLRSLGGHEREPGTGWLRRLASRLPGALYALDRLYWCGLRTFLATPKAAVYYLHGFYQFPAVRLRCWMHGVPFIYDAHDFHSALHKGPGLSWMYRKLRVPFERWLEAMCVRNAAAVVTVSEGVAALQRETFGCRPVIIRNCEDERLQRAPSGRLREVTGVAPTDFLFVVVGNAKPGQAISELLQAMMTTPPRVHVALLGLGYEQVASRIADLGLEGRVHVIPPVKPYEVVPFLQSADASMLLYYPYSANYLHCLPNGFFQAVAAGLPLLYPELPEVLMLAKEYGLGLPIDPLSPESIAEGIRAFLDQPYRLVEFRRNAERAREMLSWEHEEKILAKLLDRVLVGSNRGAL